MKTTTKNLILGLSAMLLTSCMEGKLQVSETLNLDLKKGEQIALKPGLYNASISMKDPLFGSKKLILKVPGEKKIIFEIPKGLHIPSIHGKVVLTAEQSGQPVHLEGMLDTHYSASVPSQSVQYCSVSRAYKECVLTKENKLAHVTKLYNMAGDQLVVSHQEYTEKQLDVQLIGEESGAAVFSGSSTSSSTIIDSSTGCRIHPASVVQFNRIKKQALRCPHVPRPKPEVKPPVKKPEDKKPDHKPGEKRHG